LCLSAQRLNLEDNRTFCRRNVTHECDITYNSTEHPLFPGIYRPEGDCTRTALGYFLSAGDNFSQCVPDPSDPYSTTRVGAIQQQIALDWARSNDVDPTSGRSTSVYTIPKLVRTQVCDSFTLTFFALPLPRPATCRGAALSHTRVDALTARAPARRFCTGAT
jgi:hypothetical protein